MCGLHLRLRSKIGSTLGLVGYYIRFVKDLSIDGWTFDEFDKVRDEVQMIDKYV